MRGGTIVGLYCIFDYFACFCTQRYRIYWMEHARIAHPDPAGFMASARVPALGPEYVTCADRPSAHWLLGALPVAWMLYPRTSELHCRHLAFFAAREAIFGPASVR